VLDEEQFKVISTT